MLSAVLAALLQVLVMMMMISMMMMMMMQLTLTLPMSLFVLLVHNWLLGRVMCYLLPMLQVQ